MITGLTLIAVRPAYFRERQGSVEVIPEWDTPLGQFEGVRQQLDSGEADALDRHRRRALALIASGKMAGALDIQREPEAMRDS